MSRTLMLDQVHALSKAALIGAGTLEESASIVADSIVDAEAEGIHAVGLAYLPYYCQHVRVGKVSGLAVPKVKQTGKAALMADKERILKGIIGKLISYAHGREVTLADRPYINEVYQSAANQNFSLRAAVLAIVAHPEFGRK